MVSKKTKRKSSLIKISEAHTRLDEKAEKVLENIKDKKWLMDFEFTKRHRFLDKHGIDLILCFSCGGGNSHGSVLIQEKRSKKARMKKHFKMYPCVPCYLLFVEDSLRNIEYTFLLVMLRSGGFNQNRKEKIRTRFRELEESLGNQRWRFARDAWDFKLEKELI